MTNVERTNLIQIVREVIDLCGEIYKIRIELLAIERRLKESADITPVNPTSIEDVREAFENANDFLTGQKKT